MRINKEVIMIIIGLICFSLILIFVFIGTSNCQLEQNSFCKSRGFNGSVDKVCVEIVSCYDKEGKISDFKRY